MSIFNRKKEEAPVQDTQKREVVTVNVDLDTPTYPIGLEFLSTFKKVADITHLSAGFAAIDLISNKIASIPIVVKTSQNGIEVDHSFNHVFDTTLMTKFMTIKMIVWDTLVHGNGIGLINRNADGSTKSITYIPHGSYTICYNQKKQELYYLMPEFRKGKVEPINVLHIIKNTIDGVNGKPVSYYAANAVALASTTDKQAANYFDSGCSMSGILKSNKILSAQQKLDVKSSWNEVHGPSKNGGIAVIGADMDYISTANNATESQMLESRQFNVKEIARFLGISPELIGDTTNKAYNSLEQAIQALVNFTLNPLIAILEEELNRKCLKPSERSMYYIDLKEESLLVSDKSAEGNYYKTLVSGGIMTINEAREALGLPEKEGADDLIIPFTDIASNTIGGGNNEEYKNNEINNE